MQIIRHLAKFGAALLFGAALVLAIPSLAAAGYDGYDGDDDYHGGEDTTTTTSGSDTTDGGGGGGGGGEGLGGGGLPSTGGEDGMLVLGLGGSAVAASLLGRAALRARA